MNKAILSVLLSFLSAFVAMAQESPSSIVLTTSSAGELSLTVTPVPSTSVHIDWGDGVQDAGSPNWDKSRVTFSGKAKGAKITIVGLAKGVDFASDSSTDNQLTSIELVKQTKLEVMNVKGNKLTELPMQDLPLLSNLDIRDNLITQLDVTALPELQYLTATNNKLAGIQIGQNTKLEQLNLSQNDLPALTFAHTLPKLILLNVEANSILSLDLTKTPVLEDLNINANAFQSIEFGTLTTLTKLFARTNYLSSVDLSALKGLQSLDLSANRLRKINLTNNTALTRVNLAENMLNEVVVSTMPILLDLNVRKNEQLYHLDLSKNTKLRTINADTTAIEGLDLNTNYNLSRVYLRGTRLSPYALNYIFRALPDLSQNPTGYTNIYLTHTSWKGTDLSILASKRWKSDLATDADAGTPVADESVKVDLSAGPNGTVTALLGGEEVTFPKTVSRGAIIHLDIVPKEGYELDYIKRKLIENGKPVELPVYGHGVTIDGATTIQVAFRKQDERIVSLQTNLPVGTKVSLKLRQAKDAASNKVLIDWGNGEWMEQSITKEATSTTVVDGQIAGAQIRLRGALDKIGADEMGITSADLTRNPSLIVVDLYGNQLTEIDLTKNPALANLSIGFNKLKAIDLSQNSQLEKLSIRGNKEITTLDLAANTILVTLDAKNLALKTIKLSSPDLMDVDLQGNQLNQIDLAPSSKIETLRLANNLFERIDLSPLKGLKLLNIGYNRITDLQMEQNSLLERLHINDNPLKRLRFAPTQTKLVYIDMADCQLDACQLDSTYVSLPVWKGTPSQSVPVTLFNQGLSERANQAQTSKTEIAERKGWKLTARGDGSGCPNTLALTEILAPGHGFNYYDKDGVLYVIFAPGVKVGTLRVYDFAGKCVATAQGQDTYQFTLPTGVYLLHIDGKAFPVAVR